MPTLSDTVDLTSLNPKKDSFRIGVDVNQPFDLGVYLGIPRRVGTGKVETYVSDRFVADGEYSFLGNSGSLSMKIFKTDSSEWDVSLKVTGAGSSFSRSFKANAFAGKGKITFKDVDSSSDLSFELTRDDGDFFSRGSIDGTASWAPSIAQSFYIVAT